MDEYADNYNADANIEGEECLYPCEGTSAIMIVMQTRMVLNYIGNLLIRQVLL